MVSTAFLSRMKSLYGWDLSPDLVLPLADLVQGTYTSILAFSDPGDGVVLPGTELSALARWHNDPERRLLPLAVRDDGSNHTFDLDELNDLVNERIPQAAASGQENQGCNVLEIRVIMLAIFSTMNLKWSTRRTSVHGLDL